MTTIARHFNVRNLLVVSLITFILSIVSRIYCAIYYILFNCLCIVVFLFTLILSLSHRI